MGIASTQADHQVKPRRVLHVLGTAKPAGIGIFKIVESLAAAADPSVYEIHACFLQPGELVESMTYSASKATCIDWDGSIRHPRGAVRYAALLRSQYFSIIHQHVGGRLITGMGRRLTRARMVRTLHGRASEVTGIVSPRIRIPRVDALIANSKIVADYSGDPGAVVIYPGVNVSEFSIQRTPHRGVVLGTACRLEMIKGLPCLLEAFKILMPEFPDLYLEIAGDGGLRESLQQQTRDLGLTDRVSFLGWRKDLPAVMAGWDIFAMPSLDEGFGIAALEAMAAGLPVVATEVGGLSELVQSGKTGWLVPPAAPAAPVDLAQRLAQLIRDRQLREAMGTAGRKRVVECFSTARMVEQTFAVYDRLLAE